MSKRSGQYEYRSRAIPTDAIAFQIRRRELEPSFFSFFSSLLVLENDKIRGGKCSDDFEKKQKNIVKRCERACFVRGIDLSSLLF